MRTLGKIAMVPTIASALVVAGSTAAGAATGPTGGHRADVIRVVVFNTPIDRIPGSSSIGSAHAGDIANCNSSSQSGFVACTDINQLKAGYIAASALQ